MFFASQAKNLTEEAQRIAVLQANRRRKDDASRKLDYYGNMQTDHVIDMIRRKYVKNSRLEPLYFNIVRKIVDSRAKVYLEDAIRRVDGPQADQDIFASLEESAALPVRMKMANRFSRLCGNVLLRPVWRRGMLDMDVLLPHYTDVVTGDSPEDVSAVIITHSDNSGRVDKIQYSLWTAQEYLRFNYSWQLIERQENPYRELPFVHVFSEPPADEYWQPGVNDLMAIQDEINNRLVSLAYVLDFQSFSMGYTKGGDISAAASPFEIGPGQFWHLPKDGELGFASPGAPIKDTLDSIDFLIKQAALSHGLSAANVSIDPRVESGAAKEMDNLELNEKRRDDIALFSRYEQELFRLLRVVWNTHNPGRRISEGTTMACDFYDPKPKVSEIEQLMALEKRIQMGLIDRTDAMLILNPDLSREEAEKQLAKIASNNAAYEKMLAPQYSPMLFTGMEEQQ